MSPTALDYRNELSVETGTRRTSARSKGKRRTIDAKGKSASACDLLEIVRHALCFLAQARQPAASSSAGPLSLCSHRFASPVLARVSAVQRAHGVPVFRTLSLSLTYPNACRSPHAPPTHAHRQPATALAGIAYGFVFVLFLLFLMIPDHALLRIYTLVEERAGQL